MADLIAALASPQMANRSWAATIAGDGDAVGHYEQIEASGLRRRVRLPGWQSAAQTEALLADTAILVLPSYHEVMPLAVLEAMARGIAIVTTPVGCVPDILINGVNARLVAPGHPAELGAALAQLIDSPADRVRLGDAALATFNQRLTVAATATQLQALYRQAACASRPRVASRIRVAGSMT